MRFRTKLKVLFLTVILPFTLFTCVLSWTLAMAFVHDTNPQEFEEQVVELLGVQEIPYEEPSETPETESTPGSSVTSTPTVDGTPPPTPTEIPEIDDSKVTARSAIPEFQVPWYDGQTATFWVPPHVWNEAITAHDKHQCDPSLVVSTGFYEGSSWNSYAQSDAGAVGILQFIWSTWLDFWQGINPIPSRNDDAASIDAGCRKLHDRGLDQVTTKEEFIKKFAIEPPVWNRSVEQAEMVYDLWQKLKGANPRYSKTGLSKPKGLFSQVIYWYLDLVGLLPDSVRYRTGNFQVAGDWLTYPLEFTKRITQYPSPSHLAYDFGCTLGEPVLAAADGTIVVPNRPGWGYDPNGWGYSVWIDHGNGYFSHYGHLQMFSTIRGQVKKGDQIGKCGYSGRTIPEGPAGTHLHFEIGRLHPDDYTTWDDARALVNPQPFLFGDKKSATPTPTPALSTTATP